MTLLPASSAGAVVAYFYVKKQLLVSADPETVGASDVDH